MLHRLAGLASVKAIGIYGAALMVASPPYIDTDAGKITACFGLALLTIQAVDLKQVNLIILNLASIAGFTYALWS